MENKAIDPVAAAGKIYIMYYKNGAILPVERMYEPLFCGDFPGKEKLTYLKDNTGINISEKNEFYSELTGVFWVWKNTSQEFTGICHYRRYFTVYPEPWYHRLKYFITHPFKGRTGPNPLIYTKRVSNYTSKILTSQQTVAILEEFDAILPVARTFKYSVKTHYEKYHDIRDLILIEKILKEKYPEMVLCWQQILEGNQFFANNMFVMKSRHYQEFMPWLFEILFEFEVRIDLQSYKGYQRRILGFVAERILTLWVIHKKLNVKQLQLLYFKKLKRE